jgi:hypothetical protein
MYIVWLHSFIRLSGCTMHAPHVSSRISEDGRTCLSRHHRWAARGGYSVFHNKLWSETEQSPNWCKPRWRGRSSNPYCRCTLVARHMVDIDSNHRMLNFRNSSASDRYWVCRRRCCVRPRALPSRDRQELSPPSSSAIRPVPGEIRPRSASGTAEIPGYRCQWLRLSTRNSLLFNRAGDVENLLSFQTVLYAMFVCVE